LNWDKIDTKKLWYR